SMLPEEEELRAPELEEHPPGCEAARLAAEMDDAPDGRIVDLPARLARAEAEVRLFAVHEVAFVEAADRVEDVASDEEGASRDHVDGGLAVGIEAGIELAIEEARPGKELVEVGRQEEVIERRWIAEVRALERSIAIEDLRADDPRFGVSVRVLDEPLDRIVDHERVGVEKENERRARVLEAQVHAAGEAQVRRA